MRGGYVAFGGGVIHPAFVIIDGPRDRAILTFSELVAPAPPNVLRGPKLLWIAEPSFTGDVLVRKLPGSPAAEFVYGNGPPKVERVFRVPGPAGGYLLFAGPGCYSFQIDTAAFSESFTVEVR